MSELYSFTSLEPGRFRLIGILPGDFSSPLACTLSDFPLGDCPKYDALSYAWGPAELSGPEIALNDQRLRITTALETALRWLRQQDCIRSVWIDAVCIDQANILERNAQVAVMSDIYRTAEYVIAWLGEETSDSKRAFAFLREMAPCTEYIWRRNESSQSKQNEDGPSKKPSKDEVLKTTMAWWKKMLPSVGSDLPKDRLEEYYREMKSDEYERYDGGHLIMGKPVLYYMDGGDYYSFFKDDRQADWEALDKLLARPWWSRTWIVQEIWNSSKCLIQCGGSTLEWTTFQKAMYYQEGWDDMGYMVKRTKRWKYWASLKRRYGLAIHLSNARIRGCKLSDILWNTWDREATDPRDKVFAVLSLVGGESREFLPSANYSKSMQHVYQEVAAHIIQHDKKLDILLAANGLERRSGLPSWVPDWRREANDDRPLLFVNGSRMRIMAYFCGSTDLVTLHGHGYFASGDSQVWAQFNDDLSTLQVRSFVLGTVARVAPVSGDNMTIESLLEGARSTLQRQASSIPEDELSTILRAGFPMSGSSDIPGRGEDEVVKNIMHKRRFFTTSGGHLCIGPARTQPGDNVYIIAGCNFPIVLRPEEDFYGLVGEAYVHNNMAGHALGTQNSQEQPQMEPKWVEISIR